MEVTDHVVRIMEHEIHRDGREEHARHTTDDKVRDEPDTEQHRGSQPNVAAPHRGDLAKRLDRARDRDRERDCHEARTNARIDPRREHVVSPDTVRSSLRGRIVTIAIQNGWT